MCREPPVAGELYNKMRKARGSGNDDRNGTGADDHDHGKSADFETNLQFSFVYTEEEVRIYLDMLRSGKISFPGMVTDIISLDDCVSKGLARPDRSSQRKILIKPSMNEHE